MIPTDAGWALTIAVFLPAVGAAILAMMPSGNDRLVKRAAVVLTGATFVWTTLLAISFDYGNAGVLQFESIVPWIDAIGARYHIGIDGISMPLFFLTSLLTFLCAIYTTKIMPNPGKPKGFLSLMLLLQTGMAGTFIAFDMVLFFIFWDAGPDVLHDRDVGWSPPRVRQHQVLPLHAVRLDVHADRVPGDVLPGDGGRGRQPVSSS